MRRRSPKAPGHSLDRLWMPEAKEIHRLPLMRSSPKLHCPLPPSLEPTALSFPLRKARSQARFRNEPLPELNRRHPLQNPSPRCLGPRLRQRISPRIQFQPPKSLEYLIVRHVGPFRRPRQRRVPAASLKCLAQRDLHRPCPRRGRPR